MKKILICGDSFAADWQSKAKQPGWPNLLAERYFITNLAQAGCGEYKIYRQLTSATLTDYDAVVISHTSPYRLYCKSHPVHRSDPLHSDSDLIYTDIVENVNKNPDLGIVKEYFEKFFDTDYANFVHNLICKEIDSLTSTLPVVHMSFFDYKNLYEFNNFVDMHKMFLEHRGTVNHLSDAGNRLAYDRLNLILENTCRNFGRQKI